MAATENSFPKLNATDLSTIILKGSPNPSERDAGFCSGSSEAGDDTSSIDNPSSHHHSSNHNHLNGRHHHLDQPNSPTDTSEDSVEVKVTPISYTRNKRKSTEPSRVVCGREETGPLKKRIRYHAEEEFHEAKDNQNSNNIISNEVDINDQHDQHFRPWNESQSLPHEQMPNPAEILIRHPGVTTLHRNIKSNKILNDIQDEPLALVTKKSSSSSSVSSSTASTSITSPSSNSSPNKFTTTHQSPSTLTSKSQNSNKTQHYVKTSKHKQSKTDLNGNTTEIQSRNRSMKNSNKHNKISGNSNSVDKDNLTTFLSSPKIEIETDDDLATSKICDSLSSKSQRSESRPPQRNYKNMTRERRIEANARERTRVHTISAAYDTLRKAVPAYSNSQKLSKLSVLRVACSYILTLSRMAGYDYSEDQSSPSLASCVDMVTKTIQTEGKIRKKKDE